MTGRGLQNRPLLHSLKSAFNRHEKWRHHRTQRNRPLVFAPKVRVTDEQAKQIIEKYSKCKNVSEFQQLDSKSRDGFISIFKQEGLSIRQISRLTGVSFGIVRK